MNFKKVRKIGAVAGIGAVLMLVMACALEGEAATLQPGSGDGITTDSQPPAHYGGFGAQRGTSINERPAIWVSGQGKVAIEPELAVLDLGVEVTMETVASARDEAATSMEAVMSALKSNGVEEKDIQTRNFDIRPRYEWQEVVENGTRSSRDVLVGYRVSNRLYREGARSGRGQHGHRRGDHRGRRRYQVQRPYVYGRGHLAAAGPTAGRCRERCEDQGAAFRRSLRDDSWKADLHGGAGRRTTVWGSIRRVPGICTGGSGVGASHRSQRRRAAGVAEYPGRIRDLLTFSHWAGGRRLGRPSLSTPAASEIECTQHTIEVSSRRLAVNDPQ